MARTTPTLLIAIALTGCSDPPAPDRVHDMRATLGPLDGAREHCLAIGDPVWRDECLVWQARRAAGEGLGEQAEATCDVIRTPGWTERCWEQVARRSDPERALELCKRAGEGARDCRRDTLERALLTLDSGAVLREDLVSHLAPWGPVEEVEIDHLWPVHLARGEGPCDAPEATCAQVDSLRQLGAAIAEVEAGAVRPLEHMRLGVCDVMDLDRVRNPMDLMAGHAHLDEAVELGVTLARPHRARGHVFARGAITPADRPERDYTLPDAVVAAAQARRVDLLVTLEPQAELQESRGSLIHPVAHDAEWAPYVRAVVERYDGDGDGDMPSLVHPVKRWEIGNEPSCPVGDAECLERLVTLATVGMAAVREADPEATVLMGGAAPVLMEDGTVNERVDATWRHLRDAGVLESSDALSIHYRVGSRLPPLDDYVAHWRALAGEEVPLWLTETGPVSWQEAKGIEHDPARLAGWTVHHLRTAEAAGVEVALVCRAGRDLSWEPVFWRSLQQLAGAP